LLAAVTLAVFQQFQRLKNFLEALNLLGGGRDPLMEVAINATDRGRQ
jgi:hypothetical protein